MKKIFFLIISTGFIFQSCLQSEKKSDGYRINITASDAVQIDTSEGSCPYLTKDNKGNIVLSWIKKMDSSTSVYCYAVSKDQGKTFEKAIEIPGSNNIHPHGENMPKIIFKPNGTVIAAWASANPNAKNAYSDIVYYSQSSDNGATWSKEEKLVKDTTGYDQRYFDMALLPDGNVGIDWLDNRKNTLGDGSALYFAATNGNSGFENERLLSEPCCPCCRTGIFVDSKKDIHIIYRGILNDSIRDMVHTVSSDNGKTFSIPERISKDNWVINGCPHTGPAMTENKDGIQFTWFTGGNDGGVYYCSSNNLGQTFSPREKVSGIDGRHSQITSVNDKDIAIVWNESFVKEKVFSSRIGLELRNTEGNNPVKQFITAETGNATFPVIKGIDDNSVLIAYTSSINDRDFVKYKVVRL